MTRRIPLALCVIGTALIALAYVSAFGRGATTWGPWSMTLGLALLCPGCMALGGARPGRRSRLFTVALVLTGVALVAGFGLALWLPAVESAGSRLIFGFPARAAAVLYLVGIVPLCGLPLVYAATFDRLTLTEEDLQRVRAARRDGAA